MPDLYTVKQASIALGVSPKRVRQLIEEGKLKEHGREPITILQTAVLLLREQRKESVRVRGHEASKASQNSAILKEIRALIEQSTLANQRVLEVSEASARRNEEALIGQINDLKAQLALAQSVKRGLFNRRK